MSASRENRIHAIEKWLWLGPALALGLYVGRLTSELLRPGLVGAILLTSIATVVSSYSLRRKDIWRIWPLLILLYYVLYPEPDPRVAIASAAATAIALLQIAKRPSGNRASENRWTGVLLAAVLSVGFFLLYVNTLSPGVLPADAGELQLIAAKWGVAHPPGFPLYTILVNLFSRLPFGPSAAYRTNLLSAITSTGTVLFVYLAVRRLSGSTLAGVLAAVVLGTSTTFWSQATTANVRSLTSLFTSIALYLLLVLRERQQRIAVTNPSNTSTVVNNPKETGRETLWLQALTVLVLVLAVTHHSSLVFIVGLFALYLLYIQPSIVKDRGRWPVLLLAALLALLPLLYLPVRGAASAVGAPEDLDTVYGFVSHVLGLGFRGDLFFIDQLSALWTRLLVMVNVLTFQFSPTLLVLMLIGLVLLFSEDRLFALVLAVSMAIHTLVAAVYRAPQTVEYMLPVYVLLAVLFGYTTGRLHLIQVTSEDGTVRDRTTALLAVLVVTVMTMGVVNQVAHNYASYRLLSANTDARDYTAPVLHDAPPGAIVLADWHWATPLWYLQAVEGIRSDVEIEFVFPGSGSYADTWASRIEDELAEGRPVIATHFDSAAYAKLPLPEPYHEAFLFRQDPLVELPEGYIRTTAELGPDLLIEGYQIKSEHIEQGQELTVQIAWRTESELAPEQKLYAHLLSHDGRLVAGDDQPAMAQPAGLTVNQFRLTPLIQTPPGTFELVIGSYDSQGNRDDASLAQIQVTPGKSRPITANRTYRPLVEGTTAKTLIGYDWDSTLPGRQRLYLHWLVPEGVESQSVDVDGSQYIMPEWYGPWGIKTAGSSFDLQYSAAYVPFGQGLVWLGRSRDSGRVFLPGQRVRLAQDFTTSRPVLRDLVVSLRLVGYEEDGQSWDWWDLDDSVPATGAIPTLKWIAGSSVRHPVYSTISADAWQGQEVEPLLLLYDAFTARQLPILDERMAQLAPWIPLGRTAITSGAK